MNPPIEKSNDTGKTLFQWLIPTRRFMKWFSLFLLCSFIALQLWAHYHYQALLDRDPAYPSLKALLEITIEFPPEYRENPPISQELRHDLDRVIETRKAIPKFTFLEYELNHAAAYPVIDNYLSQMKPVHQAYWILSQQVKRDIQSCTPGGQLPLSYHSMRFSNWAFDHFDKITQSFLGKDQVDEAFNNFIDSLYLLVKCPNQDLYFYCQNSQNVSNHIQEWLKRIPSLHSKEGLKNDLDTLTRIEPFLLADVSDRLPLLQKIYLYKQGQFRFGDDLPYGEKGKYYFHRFAKDQIPEMTFSNASSKLFYHFLSGATMSERKLAGLLRPFVLSSALNRYFYLCFYHDSPFYPIPSTADYKKAWIRAILKFDLLRLSLAARLYQLEAGKPVTATTDLVPTYLSEEIKNRTTGAAFQWDVQGQLIDSTTN